MSLCKNLSQKCVRLAAFVSLVAASALAVQAQVVFSPPKNISNSSGNTLAQQFQFALDAKGNVNMVWVDNSPGNYVVLFSRSSDGGVTFSAPRNISNNTTSTFSFNPKLALDSAGNIFIAWADNSQGHYANFFSRSADGGATFSAPLMISHAGASALGAQVVASSAGNVDIVWADDSLGYFAVFSTRSADSGASFSAPLQLSQNVNLSSFGPMESVDSSGNINVMWTDSGMSNYIRYSDLLFSRSVDGGATFSAPYTVDSQTNGYSQPGGISDAQFGTDASGNINVVWSRGFYNGDWDELDVLLARSTDGGAAFSSPAEISSRFGGGRYPKVALGPSGDINIAYFTNPSFPFFYPSGITTTLARSLDGGATFSGWSSDRCGDTTADYAVAVDASDKVDLVYRFGGGPNCSASMTGLLFAQSTDGHNFSTAQKISDGSFPIMILDPSNNVYVVWQGSKDIFFSRSVGLSSVTLSAADVTGGSSSAGTVTMSGPAPTGGAVVSLSSSDLSVSVPATVTIAEGTTSTTFAATTNAVSAATTATISAAFSGVTQTATITVEPPVLTSLAMNPSSTTGGSSSAGTVTLSGPAPAGGAVVALTNSNTAATSVPSSVTVPAGFTNATFTASTNRVLCPNSATITASFNGVSQAVSLAVMPFVTLPSQACSAIGAHGGGPSQ